MKSKSYILFLVHFKKKFDNEIITQILEFQEFKSSRVELLDYYSRNPEKPFCRKYINPKLEVLRKKYTELTTLS